MARRQPLVAEHAADLIDALKPADEQPLEVQLECDPQKQIPIQRVVMGLKRPGMAAPRNFLEHRCLDFDVSAPIEERADGGRQSRAREEERPHLWMHREIRVPLSVALLDVSQAVPFARQRPKRFGQESEMLHFDRQLVRLGSEEGSLHGNPVAGIEVLVERPLLLAEHVLAAVSLNARRSLGKNQKRGLPELPDGHDSAGDLDPRLLLFQLLRGLAAVGRDHISDRRVGVRFGGVGIGTELDDARQLFATHTN